MAIPEQPAWLKLRAQIAQMEAESRELQAENERLREACTAALEHISFVNEAGIKLKWPAMSMATGTERLIRSALETAVSEVIG